MSGCAASTCTAPATYWLRFAEEAAVADFRLVLRQSQTMAHLLAIRGAQACESLLGPAAVQLHQRGQVFVGEPNRFADALTRHHPEAAVEGGASGGRAFEEVGAGPVAHGGWARALRGL